MSGGPIAVVGGGIVGASVAYNLGERTERDVVVYERDRLAAATTHRATAMIGVSDPDPYHRMQQLGIRQYADVLAEPRRDARYRPAARLRIATSAEGAADLEELAAADGDEAHPVSAGVGGTRDATRFANSLVGYVPGEQLDGRFVVPSLATERVHGALYRPQYGYVSEDSRTLGPRELTMEFVERAREAGVRFETDSEVTDLLTAEGAVTVLELDGTEAVEATDVVCAAGPWNARLAAMAGLDLPIDHVLSPVFVLQLPDALPYTLPMIKDHATGVGLHPKQRDKILVTTTADAEETQIDVGSSSPVDEAPAELREPALDRARELLPILAEAELVDEWVGLGTSTPDGKPIVGWSDLEGLQFAATRAGIQYAPAIGSIVARQVVDGDPTEFYDAVSISRLEGYSDQWGGEPPDAE